MNIRILDSHLREHLLTDAKPQDIAKAMSLTSASIERVEAFGKNDFAYTIEITTNRPDMVAVRGIAEEASAILPHLGYTAKLLSLPLTKSKKETPASFPIYIKTDQALVRRVLGIVIEVEKKESPQYIKDRLEIAGIRSLNNLIDITNYVMLEIGHPCHVFDYGRLTTKKLIIRESKKGEKITTLDQKEHILPGKDIVADNGQGEIIDLLGIMGTANSVVTDTTKRILFFFDNNDPWKIRKTSMALGIRTEAATLNEKGIDPELAMIALERGVQLYKDLANGKPISGVLDIYPKKVKPVRISVDKESISKIIGVSIPIQQSIKILKSLGCSVEEKEKYFLITPPSWRIEDITVEVDVIEEIARVYGYHNIPTQLPPFTWTTPYHQATDQFFWERKIKESMKYWGFTEVYTYSMVSADMLSANKSSVIALKNPLDEDHAYLRSYVTPSFGTVIKENKDIKNMLLFEIANVYKKQQKGLPKEILTLAYLIKGELNGIPVNYQHAKGFLEQLASECGINNLKFEEYLEDKTGAYVNIGDDELGSIILFNNSDLLGICVEINLDMFIQHAHANKVYKSIAKYPAITQDLSIITDDSIKIGDIIETIKKQSELIVDVTLVNTYENTKTFHIVYQDPTKNLTNEEVKEIREKIIQQAEKKFSARVK